MRAYEEPTPGREGRAPVRRRDEGDAAPVAMHPASLTPAALLRLQRTAGNSSVVQLLGGEEASEERSPVKDVVDSGGGTPLDGETRTFMEERFGHDFGDVRVHTDGKATESAHAVQANAYTVGRDVVFRSDQWSPGTDAGRRMLAHELTHVVQQQAGPVDGAPAPGGIRVSDPSDRFEREADQVADRVMAAEPGAVQRQEDEEELLASAVQRQEDEEELQASAVQRQEDEEETA